MRNSVFTALGVLLLIAGTSANAQLSAFDNGSLVEDSANNLIWNADGGLFQVMLDLSVQSFQGDPEGFVTLIINASDGHIDLPQPNGIVIKRALSSADFNLDGTMDWYGAQAFINYLNSINWQGYNTWRLPVNQDEPWDYGLPDDPSSSELERLFLEQLGASAGSGTFNPNPAPFFGIQTGFYWSGTQTTLQTNAAWAYSPSAGLQIYQDESTQGYVLPVLTFVPQPAQPTPPTPKPIPCKRNLCY
jgi:hypothetical protein